MSFSNCVYEKDRVRERAWGFGACSWFNKAVFCRNLSYPFCVLSQIWTTHNWYQPSSCRYEFFISTLVVYLMPRPSGDSTGAFTSPWHRCGCFSTHLVPSIVWWFNILGLAIISTTNSCKHTTSVISTSTTYCFVSTIRCASRCAPSSPDAASPQPLLLPRAQQQNLQTLELVQQSVPAPAVVTVVISRLKAAFIWTRMSASATHRPAQYFLAIKFSTKSTELQKLF